jgi:hypothetical protein
MRKPITEPYQIVLLLVTPDNREVLRLVWSDNLAYHLEDYYAMGWQLATITRAE